jgi:Na+/alanine symporter
MEESILNVEYSTFTNNEGFEGGAIYSISESLRILETAFTDNFAQVAVSTSIDVDVSQVPQLNV